jgi:hypothetical protein
LDKRIYPDRCCRATALARALASAIAVCDELAISVSEILFATIQLLMRRDNPAKSESFQAIFVRR